jgi:leader peptidase (prepilin peptidase) / N-methyltransferase
LILPNKRQMIRHDSFLSGFKAPSLILVVVYASLAFAALRDSAIPPAVLAASALLAAALIALSVIDLATFRLPDAITLPMILAGPLLAFAFGWEGVLWRVISAGVGFFSLYAVAYGYRALRGRTGLGLGDAKLFAAAGAWLGMEMLPSVLLCACGVALTAVILAALAGREVKAASRIPFGPFLALGFWAVWLYGPLG